MLAEKCAYVDIEVPTLTTIRSSPFRQEIEREWENMLGHQLPRPLPPFSDFWATLEDVFAWLSGDLIIEVPPRASSQTWTLHGWHPEP